MLITKKHFYKFTYLDVVLFSAFTIKIVHLVILHLFYVTIKYNGSIFIEALELVIKDIEL